MNPKFELGIYGGTFAPVHRGHLRAAADFLRVCSLDRLLVMPTAIPPHKQICFDDAPLHRLEMAKLAFAAFPEYGTRVQVSDFEIAAGDRCYTYRTLEHFKQPGVHLTFLCGTDMFLSLDTWRYPDRIFALSAIAVARREASDPVLEREIVEKTAYYREHFHAEIVPIPGEAISISSTEIRRRVACGESTEDVLPPSVRSYIDAHRLYRK